MYEELEDVDDERDDDDDVWMYELNLDIKSTID